MKILEGINSIDAVKKEWSAQNGLTFTLFGITKNINNSERAMLGYLEELNLKANSKQRSIIGQLTRLTKNYHQTVVLLDSLQILTGLEESASKSFYFKQLVEEIYKNFEGVKFNMNSINDKILIYTQLGALAQTLGVLLTAFTTTKRLTLGFRKSARYGVITIRAPKHSWLEKDIFHVFSNSTKYLGPIKNMNLDLIVCGYVVAILQCLNVTITTKLVQNQQFLYIHVPLARQLNVFDESPLKE